ncbi:MAG TPA: RNA-binding cell elongation regulator Jag/EloR [Actinomycetota bacterium]|jgi:spoIIIJ-associated protein
MEEIERSAASVEEAVEAALAELGISEQEARIEIVQEPRGGFLGLNPQPAIVKVRSLASGRVDEGDSEEQAEVALHFLEGLMDAIGLDADLDVVSVDGVTYVDVWSPSSSEDMGILIGKRGHTLDSLQELVKSHIQRETNERCRVQVDVEDYRKRRRSRIVQRAHEAAIRVKRSGKPEALEPMTAYERKVVHDTVGQVEGLETASEGEEPERRVVIRRRAR